MSKANKLVAPILDSDFFSLQQNDEIRECSETLNPIQLEQFFKYFG